MNTAQQLHALQFAHDYAMPVDDIENEITEDRDYLKERFITEFSSFRDWFASYLSSAGVDSNFIAFITNSSEHEMLIDRFGDIYTMFIAQSKVNYQLGKGEVDSYELIRLAASQEI